MIYIFEDFEETPISKLLKYCYHSNIEFAGGVFGIKNLLEKYPDSMCCIDVVPDNIKTVNMYYELKHDYGKRVISMPCIEYAAILMLLTLEVKLTSDLSDLRIY